MSSTEFFVFRHGETDWNFERRFQGHTDIPLNSTGRLQARALAVRMQPLDIQMMLSSDLSRARETAEIVVDELSLIRQRTDSRETTPESEDLLSIPLILSAELREARLGDPEGLLREEIVTRYGIDSWERWLSVAEVDLDFAYPNGESKREQLLRVRSRLEGFALARPEILRVGVATHGGSLRRLAHSCLGAPSEAIPLPNAALYSLRFERATKHWVFGGSV